MIYAINIVPEAQISVNLGNSITYINEVMVMGNAFVQCSSVKGPLGEGWTADGAA